MSKTIEQVREELNSNIPRSAIKERDGGGGRKLSYLEGHHVIARLNEVLGIGNWAYSSEVNLIRQDTLDKESYGKTITTHHAHYLAKVRLVVQLPGNVTTEFTDYGYGDGSDKSVPGKAHELAIKEAVTDGIKRCAKNLGMSMGLALYDKEQTNVDDDAEQPKGSQLSAADRTNINNMISATAQVLVAKKLQTPEEIRGEMTRLYGASTKEALTDLQASEFLAKLKEKLNVNKQQ